LYFDGYLDTFFLNMQSSSGFSREIIEERVMNNAVSAELPSVSISVCSSNRLSVLSIPEGCPSNTEFQGKASICEGCPGQSMCKSFSTLGSAQDADQEQLDLRMNAITHKILVLSGKGGVGKSSVAASMAIALSEQGKKVGLLDVDICGPSIPHLLGVEEYQVVSASYGWIPVKPSKHNVSVMSIGFMLAGQESSVIWRGPRKTSLIKRFLKDTFWGKLDYLIVDTPPGTSDEHLSIVAALKRTKPDGAILVTTPQEVSLEIIRKEISFCKKMKLPILGIVENMSGFVCPCCGERSELFSNEDSVQSLSKQFEISFLGRVPLDPNIAVSFDNGKCIFCEHANSPAVISLLAIVEQVKHIVEIQAI